jgi:glyoxylate reductase
MPMKHTLGTVLVTGDSVSKHYLDMLADAGLEIRNPPESYPPKILSGEALKQALSGCVAYLVGGDEFASKDVLANVSTLRIIAFLGVGYNNFVDAPGAGELGIPVTNTPGALSNSVAEFTIGHLLNERRRIAAYAASFRDGTELAQTKRRDIAGHSIGIIGLGNIGTRIAEILTQGLHAKVSYFSRTRKEAEEKRLGISYRPLQVLVSEVEALIVMVPGTAETDGMINSAILNSRPSGSEPLTVINTARPEVVEPTAALGALKAGVIEAIAFDGFYKEGTPGSEELKQHPRVTITPHIASLTHDARDTMARMCVESILGVLRGQAIKHAVNTPISSRRKRSLALHGGAKRTGVS